MKRQLNFFAAPEDTISFHCWLMATFSDITVVCECSDSNQTVEREPQPLTEASLRWKTVYLIPIWAKDKLAYTPLGSMVTLDVFDSPVLEYSPAVSRTDEGCIEAGRVYWGFRGQIERSQKRQIGDIFRWIESHSELVPNWGGWRMFQKAKRFPFIRQSVTTPKPNPLFSAS